MTPEEKAEFDREMTVVEEIERRWEDAAGQHLGRMHDGAIVAAARATVVSHTGAPGPGRRCAEL